ncbi:MAG: transcription antitermination factor NusB [Ignavibacteriaceae bacterium]|nr:transcription antitermination factor NusB [Ignavibacteriaceae bacterium]
MSQVFKRRLARERVLQILYACEMEGNSLNDLVQNVLIDLSNEADKKFSQELIQKVTLNKKIFDEMISKRVANWEMNRIALIDKILLRMAICELLYFEDIPPKVSINEAIEIAKIYSTSASGKFINGILDAILNELKETGKLHKSGRGLVEDSTTKFDKKKQI